MCYHAFANAPVEVFIHTSTLNVVYVLTWLQIMSEQVTILGGQTRKVVGHPLHSLVISLRTMQIFSFKIILSVVICLVIMSNRNKDFVGHR